MKMARDWPNILKDALSRNLGSCELAREVGVAKSAVYQQCKRHGVTLPNKAEVTLPITDAAPFTPGMEEEWRLVPLALARLDASSHGRIRNADTGAIKTVIRAEGTDWLKCVELSKRFNVSPSHVSCIALGKKRVRG
jgi:hypothetical protein